MTLCPQPPVFHPGHPLLRPEQVRRGRQREIQDILFRHRVGPRGPTLMTPALPSPPPAVGRRCRHCQLIKSRTTAIRLSGHGNWLQAFSPLAAVVLWERLWKITEPPLFFSKVTSGGNPQGRRHVCLNGMTGRFGTVGLMGCHPQTKLCFYL